MMSAFLCPNAPRSLLLAAARGLTPRTPAIRALTTSQLLPCSASRNRSISQACSSLRPTLRARSAVLSTSQGQCRTFFGPAIIRAYEDLPREYMDRTGLRFRNKDLTAEEAEQIFGHDLDVASADHLLRVLHGRRVAGTLDDPTFAIHTNRYTEKQIAQGLAYLRETVKVDEVMNAGLRAEDELAQMELLDQPQGKAEKIEEAPKEEAEEYKPDPVYGRSSFDQMRARNQAKEKARQQALEEERAAAEAEGRIPPTEDDPRARSLVQVEEGQRPITNPKIAEYYKNASSDDKEPPNMSAWERIGPSATAFLLVTGFMASITMVYKEPGDRYRLMPEVSIETATVGAMVGLNVLVFLGWRIPPLWRAFNKYMIFVVGKPRPITLFTAVFSHIEVGHLVTNMIPLICGGLYLHEDLGRLGFLTLYLGCGAFGYLAGLGLYTARGMLRITSMGSSGATMGLLSAYFWDHRDDRFQLFGLPQDGVHGIVWWALLVGFHIYEATSAFALKNRTDVVGHVAGLIMGVMGIESMNWAGLGRKKEDQKTGEQVVVKDLASGGGHKENKQ